jgi:hypothetical protein
MRTHSTSYSTFGIKIERANRVKESHPMSQDWKIPSVLANGDGWTPNGRIPSSTPISANGDGWTLVQRHPPKKQHVAHIPHISHIPHIPHIPHTQQVSHFTNAFSSDNSIKSNQDTSHTEADSEITVKKRIRPESLQALIRTRIIMMLNQTKADQLCCFQPHTFRDIECNRCLPTEKQHSVIQKLLGVQLRIESTF